MHRRARYEPLVTGRSWMEIRGGRMTAIKSLTASRPWGSHGQAPGIYSPFTVEPQGEPDPRERRHPCVQSCNR